MISFTLDTNCIIDVDEDRRHADAVKCLLGASRNGYANVALVASSASERQQSKIHLFLSNFQEFDRRRKMLGFGDLEILLPLARYGISFWNNALWSDEELEAREREIFDTLFPKSNYVWADYAGAAEIDKRDNSSGKYNRWRNQILDSQAFWAHEHNGRQVFVTSDMNFKRKLVGSLFQDAWVCDPTEAARICVG